MKNFMMQHTVVYCRTKDLTCTSIVRISGVPFLTLTGVGPHCVGTGGGVFIAFIGFQQTFIVIWKKEFLFKFLQIIYEKIFKVMKIKYLSSILSTFLYLETEHGLNFFIWKDSPTQELRSAPSV